MAESVERLVNVVGVDAAQALRMAVTIPARVMGLPLLAQVAGRDVADLLVLDADAKVIGTLDATLAKAEPVQG